MDEYHILIPEFVLELTRRLEEIFVFHITYRSSDLDDRDIRVGEFVSFSDFLLHEVCEMWDDLDSASEIVSSALLGDDLFIELP